MKQLFIVLLLFIACNSYSQVQKPVKLLTVLEIKDYGYGYVIRGVDLGKIDTIYFISLKENSITHCDFHKIEVGNQYLFEIEDVDNINGHLPAALANGYYIKFGKKRIKRDGRNGNSITTTQFFSRNTKGLWIKNN
jgi:hypothetical protein